MLSSDSLEGYKLILKDAFPNQAESKIDEFVDKAITHYFGRYDEMDVADAIDKAIQTSKFFPAISTILFCLQDVLHAKHAKERIYQAPEEKRSHAMPEAVKKAFARVKARKFEPEVTPFLRAFAQKCFPGIPDELIKRNFSVLQYYSKYGRRKLDDKAYARLVLCPDGCIEERVQYNFTEK